MYNEQPLRVWSDMTELEQSCLVSLGTFLIGNSDHDDEKDRLIRNWLCDNDLYSIINSEYQGLFSIEHDEMEFLTSSGRVHEMIHVKIKFHDLETKIHFVLKHHDAISGVSLHVL